MEPPPRLRISGIRITGQKGSFEVHADLAVPIFFREGFDGTVEIDPGTIEEHIDAAEGATAVATIFSTAALDSSGAITGSARTQAASRPLGRARVRARHGRRALAWRWDRNAVRLPVPLVLRRLVLMSSGGLGREVNPLLRAATLPGSGSCSRCSPTPTRSAPARRSPPPPAGLACSSATTLPSSRAATRRSPTPAPATRSCTHPRGHRPRRQRVSALDRLYLAELPLLVYWGVADPVIPSSHGRRVLDLVPSAQLVDSRAQGTSRSWTSPTVLPAAPRLPRGDRAV